MKCPSCGGEHPTVPVGGGQFICFRCYVRLMFPGVLPPKHPGNTR